MKRNLLRLGLSLIALFVMVVANAQTYQNEEASVSWPFNDANYATQYTKSPEKGFSLVSVNTGDLKYVAKTSTKTLDKNGSPMVMAGFSPVGSTKAVEWTVKPSKGAYIHPNIYQHLCKPIRYRCRKWSNRNRQTQRRNFGRFGQFHCIKREQDNRD